MGSKTIRKKQIIITNILAIFVASTLAILSKVMLPSAVNVEDFNSIFVKVLGFQIVASLYFIMIYTHSAVVTQLFGKNAKLSNIQIGMRFGICFGLIFLLGMQEVVVSASPFSKWGLGFVRYQFFMGIGEAVVAFALCTIISMLTIENKKSECLREDTRYNRVLTVALIALTFTAERVIAYKTGIISSDIETFPVPSYGWTILFGIILGCCYEILYPIFSEDKNPVSQSFKLVVAAIGLSWIIFNSFIGWILDGAMAEVLIRSGLDVTIFFITALGIRKHAIKNINIKRGCHEGNNP
ncbi:hypothetical protein [Ruminiclostridium cellulolyticum]|uniref:Uncharacterized protein n=1 Tax=Ruminiclostridium cellulolyticum (strain ATCC 35319 / DSM 5812 / JCM 6584 / H10) TaxID=394503 RepID=B8I6Y1_RUMCH|nr:hypothetical protein [Ruminiclostridium cellulolyticum]ACL76973.1 hypothetical protein Ccel_2649 [Ruminiclostridium cellulolyticum H10]